VSLRSSWLRSFNTRKVLPPGPSRFHQFFQNLTPRVIVLPSATSLWKLKRRFQKLSNPRLRLSRQAKRRVTSHWTVYLTLGHADAVQQGEVDHGSFGVGKAPLTFELYKMLCRSFIVDGNVFALAYATLSWNLMCRTNNTESLCLDHLSWSGDSMTVYFGRMKNDQGCSDWSILMTIEGVTLKDPSMSILIRLNHVFAL